MRGDNPCLSTSSSAKTAAGAANNCVKWRKLVKIYLAPSAAKRGWNGSSPVLPAPASKGDKTVAVGVGAAIAPIAIESI